MVSAGKDFKLTVHSANKGTFEYLRQIPLGVTYSIGSLDYLDGKILVGHDNGNIVVCDVEGAKQEKVNTSHYSGEAWGLEILSETGTFLTCGDDNQFFEYSIKDRKCLRGGKIWLPEYNDGKPYEQGNNKVTASTQSTLPVHQQGRAITCSKSLGHVAVTNNYGDCMIFDYKDFTKHITTLTQPKEWAEAIKYSPDSKFLAVGTHDDTIYIYNSSWDGGYSIHYTIQYIHSSAILALDWSKDSKYLRAIDQAYFKHVYDV